MHGRATARVAVGVAGIGLRRPQIALGAWLATLRERTLAERDRWLLWAPVLLGVGMALAFARSALPPVAHGVAAIGFASLLGVLAVHLARIADGRLALAAGLALLCAGYGAAVLRTHAVAAPGLDRSGTWRIEATVAIVEPTTDGLRLVLVAATAVEGRATPLPHRIRVNLRGQSEILPGDRIALRARLQPPAGPALPGGFDYARQAYFERLGAVGYALGPATVVARAPGNASMGVAALRATMTARLTAHAPGDTGAVAAALLTGVRAGISDQVWRDFQRSGLAHLLSISGLHMVLVAGTIVGTLRYALALIEPLALRAPARKVAAVVAIAVAAGYMLLAGATVPTQRAFIMIAIALLAVIVDRDPVSMRLLAWAALVVLALRPESILGASFQLSFAAVTALIAVYETPAVRARLRATAADDPLRRVGAYVLGVAATTLIASVATTPFAAFHFQTVPTYGVLANLLAVPVTAFWIMPAGLLSVLAMPLGLDAWTVPVMAAGINVVLWIAHAAASLPGAALALSILPTAFLALVALGGLWLALWQRPWRWAGLAPIAFGILLALAHRPPDLVVAADLQMAAARTATGDLALIEWRGDRMRREQWQRGLGAARLERVLPLKSGGDALACDPAGCVLRRAGRAVALVRRGDALREDCVRADLVISDVGRCRSSTAFIDGRTARASQGMAIRLLESGPVVETVATHRGHWPWVRPQ